MTNTDMQLSNSYDMIELEERTTTFPVAINEALQNCERAHHLLLTIKNELEEVPAHESSHANSYCNISLHVNDALQSSIRSIGYGGSLVGRLRRMLTSEQRDEVAMDLHHMQREMVRTYASCQAADQELWQSLRQAVHQDPLLRDDPIAVQCVDAIEEQSNQLQTLPPTPESLLERSLMMDSMRSNLSLLEDRTEHVNPNGPLSRVLKVFKRAWMTMAHMLSSVVKTLYCKFSF